MRPSKQTDVTKLEIARVVGTAPAILVGPNAMPLSHRTTARPIDPSRALSVGTHRTHGKHAIYRGRASWTVRRGGPVDTHPYRYRYVVHVELGERWHRTYGQDESAVGAGEEGSDVLGRRIPKAGVRRPNVGGRGIDRTSAVD